MLRTLIGIATLAVVPATLASQNTRQTTAQQNQATQQDTSHKATSTTHKRSRHKKTHSNSQVRSGQHRDSAGGEVVGTRRNQTESGVVNTKTGASTLGKGVTKTHPTQGAAVTAKGDTLRAGGDSVRRMGRDSMNRAGMGRDSMNRAGTGRDSMNRAGTGRDSMNRAGVGRDSTGRDSIWRDSVRRARSDSMRRRPPR
jgi:hypothetical protein